MNGKLYNVGVYIRLSRESANYRGEESQSIENQQAMLSKFIAMMPGWVETKIYIDDGATGANFNRRGFKDMMADARQGIINLVLVKDLSRFGRNYLETGKYLEEELPAIGCRFVAFSDGIDTDTGENDIMPFLNAMNDFYVRDLSNRIKSVLTAKAKNGQKLSGTAPYGYDRHTKENTRLIADEYAAGVVRRIFEARAKGKGYGVIAGILNKENILPPRLYYFKRRNRETKAVCSAMWTERTIKLILHNELYIGNTISFKRKIRSYRDKREIKRDESEWIKTENTHTPIIGMDLWQAVQKINTEATNKFINNRKPQELKQKLPGDHVLDQTAQAKEKQRLEQQLCKLETQIEQLYEDKVSGIISAEKFSAAVNEMETRRLEVEDKYVGIFL
jgi:DNA invertase Pin-like site-specific DNA recombinase